MKSKRIAALLASGALLLAAASCKPGEEASSSGGNGSSTGTASSTTSAEPNFDPADRVVTPDSDIFNDGKMFGGTVVDYLWKTIWGENEDWDCLGQLRDNGMNWVRVGVLMQNNERLAETPVEDWKSLPMQGWSTVEYAEAILREAQEKGFRKNLFLFLSPEAASGAEQPAPKEWKGLTVEETCEKLREYCYDITQYYVDKGLTIDLYDLGNEIERGILEFRPDERIERPEGLDIRNDIDWMRENVWNIEAQLLTAAVEGVRAADPDAKINLHGSCFGLGVDNKLLRGFYQAMVDYGVPFDVIGVSYYWNLIHEGDISVGQPQPAYYTTDEFASFLDFCVNTLGKKFIFSEYVYPSMKLDSITYGPDIGYPYDPAGQAAWMRDFLKYVNDTPEVSGCIYFYPEYYPTFQSDPQYAELNAWGLFNDLMKPNAALKEFNAYKKP